MIPGAELCGVLGDGAVRRRDLLRLGLIGPTRWSGVDVSAGWAAPPRVCGLRGGPGGEGGHEHLRRWRSIAQRGMGAKRVVVPPPTLDDLCLPQAVEDLA